LIVTDGESSINDAVEASRECARQLNQVRISTILIDPTPTGRRLASSIVINGEVKEVGSSTELEIALNREREAAQRQILRESQSATITNDEFLWRQIRFFLILALVAFTTVFIISSIITQKILIPQIFIPPPIAGLLTPDTPYPLPSPTSTPIAILAHAVLTSTVQADGTTKTIANLSLNSMGLGKVTVSFPNQMDFQNSETIRLEIIPASAITLTQTPTNSISQNFPAISNLITLTTDIEIYPVMKAELNGPNFEISPDNAPEKYILSGHLTEWVWNVKAKQNGIQSLSINVSLPVIVKGIEDNLSTPLKNIPIKIVVTKSWEKRVEDWVPTVGVSLIGAIVAVIVAILGIYQQRRERNSKIAELEKQLSQEIENRANYNKGVEEQLKNLESEFQRKSDHFNNILQQLEQQIDNASKQKETLDKQIQERLYFLLFAKHEDEEKRVREFQEIQSKMEQITRESEDTGKTDKIVLREIERIKKSQSEEYANSQKQIGELQKQLITTPTQREIDLKQKITEVRSAPKRRTSRKKSTTIA